MRPAGCSGRLEEGIRAGLKTMLKSEKSHEIIRASSGALKNDKKEEDNVVGEHQRDKNNANTFFGDSRGECRTLCEVLVRKSFIFSPPAASAPIVMPRQTLNLHPNQADGSRIQPSSDDQGAAVLGTEQAG